ncbi:MAG: hypothetical protein AB8C46_20565 [Burkholderiaceae bacterium]
MAADPSEFTEAERQLFVTDHLKDLKTPTRLRYGVSRRGSLQSELNESAELSLSAQNGKTVSQVRFMSGENKLELPPITDVKSNPILLYFLEREIREMNRLTGGSVNYYRKRIRIALATEPDVQDIQVDNKGVSVAAKRIRITPYVDDPARSRYEKFATRGYEMVLSPHVPGGIVSLHSTLYAPGDVQDDSTLLWSETVSFDGQTD